MFRLVLLLIISLLLSQCQSDQVKTPTPPAVKKSVNVPKFERDSAYHFIQRQVDFGPRVPNSEGHTQAKTYLINKLKSYQAQVFEQDFSATAYTGTVLNGTNIIAQFNPQHKKRVLLAAHWDTRFIADYDEEESKQNQPILGADDGGSGVAVLLEIARVISENPIDLGVDIVLFDAEDQGESKGEDVTTWCLGAQHWSKNLYPQNYSPQFGILLDMVGAENARFTKEKVSQVFAPQVMNKIWKLAQNMGYGNYFVDINTPGITDDHYFVNTIAKIPMIDIVNLAEGSETGFGHYWHTHQDNMDIIDKKTLRAVGQVLLAVLYQNSVGRF